MDIVKRIDGMIEQRSLLKHPFYETWSAGELTQEALAGYSKEYFQLVRSVPSFMDKIIGNAPGSAPHGDAAIGELISNRQEEFEHIEPWAVFAGRLGVSRDELESYDGLAKTRKAVSDLDGLMGPTYEGGAAAMYAFEKEIPKISQTKLDGLSEFYGIGSDGDATRYFRLHVEADIRHAASWRNIMLEGHPGGEEGHIDGTDRTMIECAAGSISAQNLLLDGCYEEYCRRR